LREVDLSSSEDVPDAVLAALADVSTLETLKLSHCREVRDVSALARSVSLRELDLEGSAVSDAGIAGLERIPSLTWLSLASCESITNVTNLFRSKSLRKLVLLESSVTDAGLVGLELAPALEFVDLRRCAHADAAAVALRAVERSVKVGTRGLATSHREDASRGSVDSAAQPAQGFSTPSKDPRLETQLRNLPAERRNFSQYQTAMKAVRSGSPPGLAATPTLTARPAPRRRICRQGAIAGKCIGGDTAAAARRGFTVEGLLDGTNVTMTISTAPGQQHQACVLPTRTLHRRLRS
jgi:hypothetical protein